MQFAAREDISAPIDTVFQAVSDFEGWERAALRRGAEVTRTDDLAAPSIGMSWATKFAFRNKVRKAYVTLETFEKPNKIGVSTISSGVNVDFVIELVSLSRERTRMDVYSELKPTTISARILLQPLKLARTRLSNRFCQRIADFAGSIEDGYK